MAKVCERAHSLLVLGDCYFWLLSYQEGSWGQNHIYFGIFHKVGYNVSDPSPSVFLQCYRRSLEKPLRNGELITIVVVSFRIL